MVISERATSAYRKAYDLVSQILGYKRQWEAAQRAGSTSGMTAAHQLAEALREKLRNMGRGDLAAMSDSMTGDQLQAWLSANSPVWAAGSGSSGVGSTTPSTDGPVQGGSDYYGNTGGTTAGGTGAQLVNLAGSTIERAGAAISDVWSVIKANLPTIFILGGLALAGKIFRIRLNIGGGSRK